MTEQHFPCVSDGEEQDDDYVLSPLTNNEGSNGNGSNSIRKNLIEDFGSERRSVIEDGESNREHMKVYLRIRPFKEKELLANENLGCIEIENDKAVVMRAPRDSVAFKNSTRGVGETCHRFTFTRVFDAHTSQKSFFDSTTLAMIKDFVDGQNCLVFTYGVTNSGKTYTIQGTPNDSGILPRSLDVLFNSINGKQYKRTNLKPRYFCDVTRLDDKQEHNEELIKKTYLQSLDKGNIDLSALLKLEDSDVSKGSSFEESSLQSNLGDNENDNTSITNNDCLDPDECRVADETVISVDSQGPVHFCVWVSFAEIYNEQIFDLLEPCPVGKGRRRNNLKLGDDKNGNPYIKGLREVCVHSADEAYKILKVGQKNQSISATKLNQCSSRSHSIFSIKVLRVVTVENPHVARVSRLSFVDLAGSERYTKTHSKGDRLKEAGNINTSLMTLGKCLDYLRYNQSNPNHPLIIPFRESKLTRLFQGTFGGKGKACMVVNVNQCASTYDETCHCMKFSAIAKQVTTKITKPVDLVPPPAKKVRGSSILVTPGVRGRGSIAWADEDIKTPKPKRFDAVSELDEDDNENDDDDNSDHYQQQLIALVKGLQEQLIAEKKSKMELEMKIRDEVCVEMAQQLVAIENAYSDRMHDEVLAVEEKCDRRIELLTKSMKKCRKRARVDKIEDEDDEWVSSVLLHAEKTRVQEKDHFIQELNAKIVTLNQELKKVKEANEKQLGDSEVVLELQTRLNEANSQIAQMNAQNAKLQQTLDDAAEAFAVKESEILKLKNALEQDDKLKNEQNRVLSEVQENLSSSVVKIKELESRLVEKNGQLVKYQDEIKVLESSLEEALLEDSQRALSLKKALDDKELEARELLAAKDEIIQKLELNIRDHSAALNDHETFVEALNKQVKQLTKELEETKCSTTSASHSTEKSSQTEIDMKDNMLKDLVKSLEETRNSLEKEKESSSRLLQKEKDEIAQSKEKLVDLEEQLSHLQKQVEFKLALRESESNAKMESEVVSNREHLLVQERDDLKKRLKAADTQIENLEELVSKSKESVLKSAKEIELKMANEEENKRLQEMLLEARERNEELLKLKKGLTNTLENTKAENVDMKFKESKLLLENEKLEETLRSIKNEKKVVEEQAKENKSRLASIQKERSIHDKKKDIYKDLNCKVTKLEEFLQKAKAEKADLEKAVKGKDEKLESLLKEKKRLMNEKEMRINREKRLEKDKQRLGELMLAAENKCKVLERTLKEKEIRVAALEEAATKVHEKSSSIETSSVISSLENQLEEATKALDKKNTQLIARNNSVKRLELALEDTKSELEKLKRETKIQGSCKNPFEESKVVEMQATIVKQLREIETLIEKSSCMESQRKEIELDLELARTQLTETNKMLSSRSAEVDILETKLGRTRDYERSMDVMRSELLLARDSGRLKEAELNKLKEENSRLLEIKKSMTEETNKQDKTLVCLKKVIDDNEKILDEQEKALEIRQNEMESLTTELNAERERADALAKEIEKKEVQLENMKEEIDFLTEENTKFEKEQSVELDELKKEKIGLLGEIQVQRCTIEQLRRECRNTDKWSEKEKDLLEREITEKDEKINKLRERVTKLEEEKENLEDLLDEKERTIKKTEEQKEKTMTAMREALEIAKAKKSEYESVLRETRDTCEKEVTEKFEKKCSELETELSNRQATIDRLQQQVEELAQRSTQQDKENIPRKTETDETSSASKPLKRKSSELTLAEVKRQLEKKQKPCQDSDEEFTPGSNRRSTKSRGSSRKTRRQHRSSPSRTALSPMRENQLSSVKKVRFIGKLGEIVENSAKKLMHSKPQTPKETANSPTTRPSTAKKGRRKLLQLASSEPFSDSPGVRPIIDPVTPKRATNKDIITRTLRSRTIKSTK